MSMCGEIETALLDLTAKEEEIFNLTKQINCMTEKLSVCTEEMLHIERRLRDLGSENK